MTKESGATIPPPSAVNAGPIDAPSPRWGGSPIAALRIAFGLVWLFDASLKWSPAFVNNFTGYVQSAKDGQSGVVRAWLDGWTSLLGTSPHVFARLVGVTESLVALCLILGFLTNAACVVGGCLSLAIWSTAEGFGGPYMAGSTDVGASIVYVLLFGTLLFSNAGATFGLDAVVRQRLGRLRWLSSASPAPGRSTDTPARVRPVGASAPVQRVGAGARVRRKIATIGVLCASGGILFAGLSTAFASTAATDSTDATATMTPSGSGSMTMSGGGQDAMDPGGQGNVRR